MFKTYIKCSKCNQYSPYGSSYALYLERNTGSATVIKGKFTTYICENCAYELMDALGKEDNNGTTEEEKNE